MTEQEQRIYNDLSAAGWNLFTSAQAKIEVARYLASLNYTKERKND